MTFDKEDIWKLKGMCLKMSDIPLLEKILEMEDYMAFFGCDEIEIDLNWRKAREEEQR